MTLKKTGLLLLIVLSFTVKAQLPPEWAPAGMPLYGSQVRCVYSDTINDILYVTGEILTSPTSFSNYYICKYNGSGWSTLGAFNDQLLSLTTYNGELIAAGFFTSVSGTPVSYIAKYNGTSWQPFGNFDNPVTKVKVINGELYAVGYFSIIDGVPIHRAAKWNGSTWSDIHGFSLDPTGCMLFDIEIYNGNVYVCGNFYDDISAIIDLAVYKDGIWQKVGVGITGAFTSVTKFAKYKNELVIVGGILKPEGNVGHGIQKWNDTVWSEVGDGVQDWNNGYSYATIIDATVYDNELYVSGAFGHAGHIQGNALAKWDGIKWCGLATKNVFNVNTGGATSICFFNDTLYLGLANDTLNNIFTNSLIKYLAGSYTDTCSINYTGVDETINYNSFSIYPNPAQSIINIEFENSISESYTLSILNVLGETVYSKQLNDPKLQISVDEFPSGIYVVQVQNEKDIWSKKFIKQ
ncbi:MAG: T9SS type A sorting domain-containing protein [Bacteroidia bacterium]|nr:T9SS type A sorting domain-containing protein [Bacteroidia bacterium]